jgi:hypothetical protein
MTITIKKRVGTIKFWIGTMMMEIKIGIVKETAKGTVITTMMKVI